MREIRRVLFVCLGNTARSPAAEYLAKLYAKKFGLNLKFQSAGFINAFTYMQTESKHYLDAKGIDSSDFRPQLITRTLLEQHDLILAMERSHVHEIVNNFGDIKGIDKKVYTLKQFNGETEDLDITDPYYTSRATYFKVLQIIDENVELAIKRIKMINQKELF